MRKGDGFLYKIKTHYFTMIEEFSDQAHFDKLILKELQKYSWIDSDPNLQFSKGIKLAYQKCRLILRVRF